MGEFSLYPRLCLLIYFVLSCLKGIVFFIFKTLFYGLEAMCYVSFFQRKCIINSIFFYQNWQLFRISVPLPNQKGLYRTIYWTLSPISLDRAIENYRFTFFPKILLWKFSHIAKLKEFYSGHSCTHHWDSIIRIFPHLFYDVSFHLFIRSIHQFILLFDASKHVTDHLPLFLNQTKELFLVISQWLNNLPFFY